MKKLKGFSLVELIIAMGIMTILLTVLTQTFGSILSLRQKSEAVSSIAQDSRFVLLRLAYDTGRATSISTPSVGSSSSTLTMSINSQSYVYSLLNGNLILSVAGGQSQQINSVGTTVTNLSFTRNNNIGNKSVVQLDLTLRATEVEPGVENNTRRIQSTLITQ